MKKKGSLNLRLAEKIIGKTLEPVWLVSSATTPSPADTSHALRKSKPLMLRISTTASNKEVKHAHHASLTTL